MIEIFFEIFGELFLQIVVELVFAAGFRAAAQTLKGEASPPVAVFVHALFGALFGLLSVALVPRSFLHRPELRVANLVVTPIVVGALMGAIGGWRKRRDRFTVRLDSFGFAYVFALTLAAARYFLVK